MSWLRRSPPASLAARAKSRKRSGWLRRLLNSPRLFPRKLTLTREGKFIVAITLGVGFAAINTGNNLLYLVLGMLLSLMVTSGILSEITLRGLQVRRIDLDALVAGQPGYVRVHVANTKRWFASFSVEISEVFDEGPDVDQVRGYILHLPAGATDTARIRLVAERRGELQSEGLSISTRFPFSFFRKSRVVLQSAIFIIHPRMADVVLPTFSNRHSGSEEQGRHVGDAGDVYGLRDYRSGDSARDVHWKASARRRRLVAKELERPATRTVVVALPSAVPDGFDEDQFEWRVEVAAGLAVGLLDRGFSVGILSHDGFVGARPGPAQRQRILDHLARLVAMVIPGGALPPELAWPDGLIDRVVVPEPGRLAADSGSGNLAVEHASQRGRRLRTNEDMASPPHEGGAA